jgi:hypothetical protein
MDNTELAKWAENIMNALLVTGKQLEQGLMKHFEVIKNALHSLHDSLDATAKDLGYRDIDHMLEVIKELEKNATEEDKENFKKAVHAYWYGH